MSDHYSRNQVKAAGKYIREIWRRLETDPDVVQDDDAFDRYVDAIEVLNYWRAKHVIPLNKATMGLRSRCATANCSSARVSQRLKRHRTIVDKLQREPSMQLTTMHDIGGCRAVLDNVDEIRNVQKRWHKRKGHVVRTYDYLTSPKPSGYRGLHLVVGYDDLLIEIQLRTRLQHAWATAVEEVGPALGHDLKSGKGPAEILDLFRHLGNLLAQADGLVEASPETYAGLRAAIQAVPNDVLKMIGLGVTPQGVLFSTEHQS